IAGVLLIVNIFVMLAEERKGEMGVARALGMRRKNLVQSFVSEGLLYALLSSVVGMFGGLLIAGVILWGFSKVFQGGFGVWLVRGGRLKCLFNSEGVRAVATRLAPSRRGRPVVRAAIAYPQNKKLRTGATLASIAFVMFTIATMSCIQAMVCSSITTANYRE